MRRTLAVVTAGCKANFADSAEIASRAARAGFDVVPSGDPADVVVINSCTVTHKADRDSRALARRLRRGNPRAVLVMTGCYAQTSPESRTELPEVDHWVGIADRGALTGLLDSLAGGLSPREEAPSAYAVDRLLGRTRTFLKVHDGCDAVCAYCIVPMARGGSRSVPPAEVVEWARRAEADGARELVLTGIHVGRYGTERGERDGLATLLEMLLSSTTKCRYRLGSVEPLEVTWRLVSLLAGEGRICPHLHVPMQSGSDAVLRRMRRPYTAKQYRERLHVLSREVPGIRLGADVIAGFPGESEKEFGETLELIGASPLSYLHAFPYSPRKGTESAAWRDDVPPAEKKLRVGKLRDADAAMRGRYLESQVGRTLSVVVEASRGTLDFRGTSENYVEVAFRGDNVTTGEVVPVRVLSVQGGKLKGRA
jgi:threonylcarbamoyladenosine tRNA methylthiotransferase MtaB